MSTEPNRTGRTGPSTASSSTVAIVLAVLAAVIGFFIIRQVRDDGDDASTQPTTETSIGTGSTIDSGEVPSSTAPTPTSGPTFVTTGTSVQVANASAQNGVAGQLTTALAAQQFTMAPAANATEEGDTTRVLYDAANPAAQPVANSVALMLGVASAEPLPSPVPVDGGALPAGCGVLVMLGNDKAGKPLAEMGGTLPGGSATTVAGATTTAAGSTTTTSG
jgi:hypothetical protein